VGHAERRAEIEAEQSSLTKDEIRDKLEREAEFTLDLDNLPKVKHHFVKRGIVLSCEGAGHPSHRHFLH